MIGRRRLIFVSLIVAACAASIVWVAKHKGQKLLVRKEGGFSIVMPKGWIVDHDEHSELAYGLGVTKQGTTGYGPFFNIAVFDKGLMLPTGVTLKRLIQQDEAAAKKYGDKVLGTRTIKVANVPAEVLTLISDWGIKKPLPVKMEVIRFTRGQKFYLIVCMADVDTFPKYEKTFREILNSFKFTE